MAPLPGESTPMVSPECSPIDAVVCENRNRPCRNLSLYEAYVGVERGAISEADMLVVFAHNIAKE